MEILQRELDIEEIDRRFHRDGKGLTLQTSKGFITFHIVGGRLTDEVEKGKDYISYRLWAPYGEAKITVT